METEKITVLSFKSSGKYYSEHTIEVSKGIPTYQLIDIIMQRRNEFPADMDLLVYSTDNPENHCFVPHLIHAGHC